MTRFSLKYIASNLFLVLALISQAALASDTCERISLVDFYDPAYEQGKLYGDIDIAAYNDTVYFLASSTDNFTPELWKYNVNTRERPKFLLELERGGKYFQLNIDDSVYLQLFSNRLGMVAVDLKSERVKRFQSNHDLSFRGYSESKNMLVFTSSSDQSIIFWGFDIGSSEKPYQLGKEVPADLITNVSYEYLLPNDIVVTGQRGNSPVESYLISRDSTPTVTALTSAEKQSVKIFEYAFSAGNPYFTAESKEEGLELWKLDVERMHLSVAGDINPGADSSYPFGFTQLGDDWFFLANTKKGRQLWSLNVATTEPPVLHSSFSPAPKGVSSPRELVVVGESLYFSVTDPLGETALWSYEPAKGKSPKLEHDFDPGVLAVTAIGLDGKETRFHTAFRYFLSQALGKLFVAVEKNKTGDEFHLWMLDINCGE